MTRNKNTLTIAGLALLLGLGSAQAAQDLLTTYQQALEGDPRIGAARAQLRADQEKLAQARSLFLPQIGIEAGASRVDQNTDFGPSLSPMARDWDGSYDSHQYGIGLTQPLFRMESFTLYGQAKTLIDQARINYALARQDLTLRVAEGYFRVLQAQNALQTYEAELAAVSQLLARAKKAFEVGAGTVADVNDAQARHDLTQSRRLAALNDLQLAREALRRITGQPVGELAPLAPSFDPVPPQPASSEAWAARAEQANLDVRLAEASFALARDEVERQRAQRYPKVDLVARYGKDHQSDTAFGAEQDVTQGSVGVTLSMPLYTGGAISSQVREAVAKKDQALEQVRGVKRAATLAAESAYLSLSAALQQVKALEQALKSITINEESTRKGVELGLRTTLDLLNVQRERYAAERDLSAARYSYLMSYLRLRAAVGEAVEPEAIRAVNQFLTGER